MQPKTNGGVPSIGTLSRVWIVLLLLLAVPAVAQEESKSPSPSRPGQSNGYGRDDPTENVKALSEAANKRQDDLRVAQEKLNQARHDAAALINDLNIRMNKELREAAIMRLDSEGKLRGEYEALLRQAEAKRLDAIRLVDVSTAATLAQRTTEQATALATVVTQSAEVLRNQVSRAAEDTRSLVATTAATALQNQQQQFQAITTRLAALEQAGAEGKGKQQFQDPTIAQLITEVRTLAGREVSRTGVDTGRSDVVGWIVAGIMLLIALGGLALNALRAKQGS